MTEPSFEDCVMAVVVKYPIGEVKAFRIAELLRDAGVPDPEILTTLLNIGRLKFVGLTI